MRTTCDGTKGRGIRDFFGASSNGLSSDLGVSEKAMLGFWRLKAFLREREGVEYATARSLGKGGGMLVGGTFCVKGVEVHVVSGGEVDRVSSY